MVSKLKMKVEEKENMRPQDVVVIHILPFGGGAHRLRD